MWRAGVRNCPRIFKVAANAHREPKRILIQSERNFFGRPWRWRDDRYLDDIHYQITQNLRQTEYEIDRFMNKFLAPYSPRCRPFLSTEPFVTTRRIIPVENESNDKVFKLRIDLEGYKPEEINVKLRNNVVEIKAESKADAAKDPKQSYEVQNTAYWKYLLPEEVEVETLQTFITEDGVLILEAQRKAVAEKEIPIQKLEKK